MTRSRMSRRSVTRSAIRPPSWVNIVDELLDGPDHRADRRAALADPLLGGADPGPVLRQRRRGRQHLRGRAGGVRGPLAQPVGDRAARRP